MTNVISNAKGFHAYLWWRRVTLFGVLLYLIFMLLNWRDSLFFQTVYVLTPALLIPLILYETLQRPAFFALEPKGQDLIIHFYQPDTRGLFTFHPSKVRQLVIQPGDRLEWQRQTQYGFLDELHLLIDKEEGTLALRVSLDFFFQGETESDRGFTDKGVR